MKKLATLLIAAGLAFGVSTGASAVDFKASGSWLMSFDYGKNGKFTGGNGMTGYGKGGEDEFEAIQRVRLQLDAAASEALSGTLYFEIGQTLWGHAEEGGALGADGKTVKVRRAYIDWMPPETGLKVRMGLQGLGLPNYTMGKSQVFEDDVAAVTLSYQFSDNVGMTAFWARPYNDNYTDVYAENANQFQQDIAPLMEGDQPDITLDCTDMEYTSSQGLRMFLMLQKSVNARNGKMVMKNMKPQVKEVFDITGFSNIIKIL
ncbi:MAG: STAS domain-containing protein [Oscillospiraceae bacterium]|nr:STAS domain-containing protein [Oscillospiraceae bacterium]